MKKRILTNAILLLLIACQPLAIRYTPTAPPPASTPALITGDTPEPPENPAGAVFWPITPAPLCARVTAVEALHLRATPREGAPFLAYLRSGEQVRVLDPAGRWWKVRNAGNVEGYANSRYLQEEKCQ